MENQSINTAFSKRDTQAYSMKSVKFWCHNCRKEFSRFLNNELPSEVFCGQCHNACELINQDTNPQSFNVYNGRAQSSGSSSDSSNERQNSQANSSSTNQRSRPVTFHFVTFTEFVPDPLYLLILQELFRSSSRQQENCGAPPASDKEMFSINQYQILSSDIKEEGPCSICQEDYCKGEFVSEMPCKHKFHKSCLDGWLNLHNTCPMCRKSLSPEN